LGAEIPGLVVKTADPALAAALTQAQSDIASVTRAQEIIIMERTPETEEVIEGNGRLTIALTR
jgi:hypothetical protein